MKRNSGFTLIELVMVIVILGILAATVLPKFVDLGGDARISVIKATEGAMRTANGIVYAKAGTAGKTSMASDSVTIAGQSVSIAYGFAADAANLVKVMDLSAEVEQSGATLRLKDAATPATCSVTYSAATGDGDSPAYIPAFTGCD